MDWKQKHANDSEKSLEHKLVKDAIDEFLFNLKTDKNSFVYYGIMKVAMYVASIARAQALGFDPKLLRLTPDEGNERLLNFAAQLVLKDKDVTIIEV